MSDGPMRESPRGTFKDASDVQDLTLKREGELAF